MNWMLHKNVSPRVRVRILFERRIYPRHGGDTRIVNAPICNAYDKKYNKLSPEMRSAACSCFRVRCYKWCPNGNCVWWTFLSSHRFITFNKYYIMLASRVGICQWITRAMDTMVFFLKFFLKGFSAKAIHVYPPLALYTNQYNLTAVLYTAIEFLSCVYCLKNVRVRWHLNVMSSLRSFLIVFTPLTSLEE